MIISFSGLDGAGKTTQINMLLDFYRKQGAKVGTVYSYKPDIRYHSTRELHTLYENLRAFDVIHVRYRLNSDKNNAIMRHLESKIPPQPIMASFAAIQGYLDHKELRKNVLEPLIEKGKVLIFDRYYYDELAFKHVYGCPGIILKSIYQKARDADLSFLVRISSNLCMDRNRERPDSNVPLYQSSTSINSLVTCFDYIAEKKKLITLDGSLPQEMIAQLVRDHISVFHRNDAAIQ